MNGREGWYVASFDPAKEDVRHFRLDRVKTAEMTDTTFEPRPEVNPAADVDGWPRTGEVEASKLARVWVSAERARWAREERRVVAGARRRRRSSSSCRSRAPTTSSTSCCARPATPPCSSPPTRARPSAPRSSACAPAAAR